MSVSYQQHVMYGYRLPYPKPDDDFGFDDPREDYWERDCQGNPTKFGKDGIYCALDGMSGKYMMVGILIDASEEDQPLSDIYPADMTIPTMDIAKALAIKEMDIFDVPADLQPKLYFFTHWY